MNLAKILGIVRHVGSAVAGILVADGVISASVGAQVTGGIVFLVVTIWSVVSKHELPEVVDNSGI